MTFAELLANAETQLRNSWSLKGIAASGAAIIAVLVLLVGLLLIVIVLHKFFKKHPLITRARKTLTYLVTMAGVAALILAGITGILLPIIPGIALLLAGFLLLRKYHKFKWIEDRIKSLKKKIKEIKNRNRKRKEQDDKNDKKKNDSSKNNVKAMKR